jgi:hypothetical protein
MIGQHLHIAAPDIDDAADLTWQRQQLALQSLSISDVLAAVDEVCVANATSRSPKRSGRTVWPTGGIPLLLFGLRCRDAGQ